MFLSVRKLMLVAGVGCACALSMGVCGAMAEEAHPGWEVFGRLGPTVLAPGGEGTIALYLYNVGAAPNTTVREVLNGSGEPVLNSQGEPETEIVPIPITVTDTMPAGLEAVVASLPPECSGTTELVTCTHGSLQPAGVPEIIGIPVRATGSASGEVLDHVTVSGGGALASTSNIVPIKFGTASLGLGFAKTDLWLSNANGTADTQAGSHPYDLTFVYSVNSNVVGFGGAEEPSGGEALDLDVKFPPGIVGNPTAVPRCTRAEFDSETGDAYEAPGKCPADSQIGFDIAGLSGSGSTELPVFNLVPPPGVAAQFAFDIDGIDVFLDARVRSGGDYGITEHVDDLPKRKVVFNSTTIWGVPVEASHDFLREGTGCVEDGMGACGFEGAASGVLDAPHVLFGSYDGCC